MQAMDAITEMTNITAEIGEYKNKRGLISRSVA
jgi:hypothetical protein